MIFNLFWNNNCINVFLLQNYIKYLIDSYKITCLFRKEKKNTCYKCCKKYTASYMSII